MSEDFDNNIKVQEPTACYDTETQIEKAYALVQRL